MPRGEGRGGVSEARRVKGKKGTRPAGTQASGARLRVKQVRSGIGHPAGHRRTLEAIGLRHHQDVAIVTDTPQMRGMLVVTSSAGVPGELPTSAFAKHRLMRSRGPEAGTPMS